MHFVTMAVDGGPIIAQGAVPVRDDDTISTLSQRILVQEHVLLPRVVALIPEGKVRLQGWRIR